MASRECDDLIAADRDLEAAVEKPLVGSRPDRMSPRVVAKDLASVESPVLGPNGWLLNVCSLTRDDEPAWRTRGGEVTATLINQPVASTFVLFSTSTSTVTGIPAALAFGPDGGLYVADEGHRSILRVDSAGVIEPFVTSHDGRRLNGPNDLCFDEDGSLYFTDPWTSSPRNPVGAIYGVDWTTRGLNQIDDGMQFPNGIVVRNGHLYVAETFTRSVWVYDIDRPGHAVNRRLHCRLPRVVNPSPLPSAMRDSLGVPSVAGPDGMALDADGRLWVAAYGAGAAYVFDQAGKLIEILLVPGRTPTNLCFGGARLDELFVSVDDSGLIVAYPVEQVGVRLPHCPSNSPTHPWAVALDRRGAGLPGSRELSSTPPRA